MTKLSIFTKAELQELEALEIRGGTAQPMSNDKCINTVNGCGRVNKECTNAAQCDCPVYPTQGTTSCTTNLAVGCGSTQGTGCTLQGSTTCTSQAFSC